MGKNSLQVVGLDRCGTIVLRQEWSRGQIEARSAAMASFLTGMEACVGVHHLSRKLQVLDPDAQLMPANYVPAVLGVRRTIGSAALRPTSWLGGLAGDLRQRCDAASHPCPGEVAFGALTGSELIRLKS